MMADVFKQGGSAGQVAAVSVSDAGALVVTDGTTTATLTQAILGGLAKISGFVWDLTGATTGAAYVSITDNLAAAFSIKEGSNSYLTFKTTNDKEAIVAGKIVHSPVQPIIDMAGATNSLVLGTAGAGQTKLLGNVVLLDATLTGGGTSAQSLRLPPVADFLGRLDIVNVGGEIINIKDSNGADTLINGGGGYPLDPSERAHAIAWCTGTEWYVIPS